MDSTEERITFESMPAILAQMRNEIRSLTRLVENLTPARPNVWMSVDDLHHYLPGHPAPRTIYSWARSNTIPHYNRERNLYFNRQEIDRWLAQQGGKR